MHCGRVDVIGGHVLEALEELADERLQRRLWFSTGANGAEISSLSDCRCQLYDHSGLKTCLDRNQAVFDDEIDDDLRSLAIALRSINDRRSPESIFDEPAMTTVRERAATILRAILAHP
jgi:hypothetical protein